MGMFEAVRRMFCRQFHDPDDLRPDAHGGFFCTTCAGIEDVESKSSLLAIHRTAREEQRVHGEIIKQRFYPIGYRVIVGGEEVPDDRPAEERDLSGRRWVGGRTVKRHRLPREKRQRSTTPCLVFARPVEPSGTGD